MNKRYETTTRAYSRCFVNQSRASLLQLSKRSANVFDLNCGVMHSGTAFSQELPHRSLSPERFQQFDVGVTHSQHANLYALFRHFLGGMNLEAQCVPPDGQTLLDALGGDPDVINFQQPE